MFNKSKKKILRICSVGRLGALTASSLLGIAALANAQTPATPSAGGILQSITPGVERPASGLRLEDRLQKGRGIADVEGLRFDLKGFRLSGLSAMTDAELQAELVPFLGANRNFQTLLDAAAKIKETLARKGYFLSDAIIPEQSIAGGVVEILVVEGRLGRVKLDIDADAGISRTLVTSYLERLQPGQIISAADVERALFLISDLKGIDVRSVFEPGEKVGTADLTVKITRARSVEGTLDFDANGSVYTGVMRIGGSVDWNNPTGRGDVLGIRYNTSADADTLQYMRLSYLAPIGSMGTKIGASFSDLKYKLGTPTFAALDASGYANVGSVVAIHPFVRSRNSNLLGIFQKDHRKFHDLQRGAGTEVDKFTDVSSFAIAGDLRDSAFGGGINVYNVAQTLGRLDFGTAGDRATDLAGRKTSGNYSKTNVTFSRLQRISEGTSFYFSHTQQFAASKNLDASEKLSLGGPNAVRAYPQGEGAGDQGFVTTFEMRIRVPLGTTLPGNMVFTAFHDVAASTLNRNPLITDTIHTRRAAGVGIGINWEVQRDWFLRTTIAVPQSGTATSEHVKRDPRIYLQFSKYL